MGKIGVMPSVVLRALGIALVLIGLTGTIGGLYALKVVHAYDFGEWSPEKVSTSIEEISKELEKKKEEIDTAIDEVGEQLNNASESVDSAGDLVSDASGKIGEAAGNMSIASGNLRSASVYNRDAGAYLGSAATGLKEWAGNYDYNGTSLPGESDFVASVDKMKTAAGRLDDTGAKLDDTSDNIMVTALSLKESSSKLEKSSAELKDVGKNLNQTRNKFQELKEPLGSFILTASNALMDSTKNIEALSGIAASIKTVGYLLVGYLIVFHLLVLGVGIALIIIDVNLFYPGGK